MKYFNVIPLMGKVPRPFEGDKYLVQKKIQDNVHTDSIFNLKQIKNKQIHVISFNYLKL